VFEGEESLAAEARRLAPGLVGEAPSPPIVARYVAAHRALIRGPHDPRQVALAAFAVRHPWSASPLDAACGLVRPDALLRRKLRLLAAVLEATPDFASAFLPSAAAPRAPLLRLLVYVAVAGCRALAGLALYPLAARR